MWCDKFKSASNVLVCKTQRKVNMYGSVSEWVRRSLPLKTVCTSPTRLKNLSGDVEVNLMTFWQEQRWTLATGVQLNECTVLWVCSWTGVQLKGCTTQEQTRARVWSWCFVSPTISYLLLQSKDVITTHPPLCLLLPNSVHCNLVECYEHWWLL